MSLTKRMLEEKGFFDESGITRKCPKCNEEMTEDPQGEMTEGQEADHIAGFNHPLTCTECGYSELYDTGHIDSYFEDSEIDELVKITRVDPNSFEDVIENALSSKCFIEAISLIHNVIEAYLKKKIEDLTNNDEERLKLLINKFNPRYLHDYNTINYLLGIINKTIYKSILDFNEKRNKVIHKLLTKPKSIDQIKAIARKGRELQMKLSPLNHSITEIKGIMDEFDRITQ